MKNFFHSEKASIIMLLLIGVFIVINQIFILFINSKR